MTYFKEHEFAVSRIEPGNLAEIHAFLVNVFHKEQGIPLELIPINSPNVYWWGILGSNQAIMGIAATWQVAEEWHWGRFSIRDDIRGLGLGEKLARTSLEETFALGVDYLTIDARDAIVHLIKKFGGTIDGATTRFYSENLTPMKLEKENFTLNQKS